MQTLFVHGMGRTPFSAWGLLRLLRGAGFDTQTLGYCTALEDFERITARLSSRIIRLARRGDYILIGHSLGGVLLRGALAALPEGVAPPRHVFLVGSPVHAARLAGLLQRNPLFRLLTRDCGQLLASHERMQQVASVGSPVTAIVGERPVVLTQRFFGSDANDGVVSTSETRADWLTDTVSIPVMHSFLPGSPRVAEVILRRLGR